MSEFNFNSKVCTSIEQSRRVLALGLKAETADMIYERNVQYPYDYDLPRSLYEEEGFITGVECDDIPAWSLPRLWELLGKIKKYEGEDELLYPRISLVEDDVIFESPKSIWVRRNFCSPKGVYENIINCLEELIKEGYFPKKYLV